MTVVLVSSNEPALAGRIGADVAEALGTPLVTEEAVVGEVARRSRLPADRLRRALAPGRWRLSAMPRAELLTQIQTLTLERLAAGPAVCVDLAAHLYVRGVSHALTVRVLSSAEVPAVEGVGAAKAGILRRRRRAQRSRWSLDAFGSDEEDPANYDLVVSVKVIEPARVVEMVASMAGYRKFKPMSYSKKCLDDLLTASRVREVLLPRHPQIHVRADGDTVRVRVKSPKRRWLATATAIKARAAAVAGVSVVEVHPVSTSRELGAATTELAAVEPRSGR